MFLFVIVIFFIHHLTLNVEPVKSQNIDSYCPFPFQSSSDKKCWKIKDKETFDENFVDCIGNSRSTQMQYEKFPEKSFWQNYGTDYTSKIYLLSNILRFENMCYTSKGVLAKCDSYQSKLCEIDSINQNSLIQNNEKCKEGFFYYGSPKPICLTKYIQKNGTRKQMEKYCENLSGKLIKEGMIYINSLYEVPTSIIIVADGLLQYENVTNFSVELQMLKNKCRYTADLQDKYISMVNSSYCIARNENFTYEAVICEHPVNSKVVTFKNMGLKLTPDGGRLYVEVETNKPPISYRYISCFTDNDNGGVELVNVSITEFENIFELDTNENGLYRCISNITDDGHIPKSPLVLFINNTDDLIHTYIFYFNERNHNIVYEEIIDIFFSTLTFSTKTIEYRVKPKSWYYNSYYVTTDNYLFDKEKIKNVNLYSVINETYTLKIVNTLCEEVWNIITADGSCAERRISGNRLYSWNASECTYESFHCDTIDNSTFKIVYPIFKGGRIKCGKNFPPCFNIDGNVIRIHKKMESIITETISEYEVHDLIDNLSDVISSSNNTNRRGEILQNLDIVLKRMDLKQVPGNEFHSSSPNLLVGVIEVGNDKEVIRCQVKTDGGDFKEKQIEFLKNETSSIENEANVIVELQTLKMASETNLAIVVMKDDKLFTSDKNEDVLILNSMIIGISVDNFTFSEEHPYIDIHFKPKNIRNDKEVKCAFWDFNIDEWSVEGCVLINEEIISGLHTCRCTHMTHFAEILLSRESKSQKHQMPLTIISYISCTLSLFGLLIIAVTAIVFKKWRRDFKIHLNLSAAIAILQILFLMNTFMDYASNNLCLGIGALMHYIVLTTFTWVLIVALIFDAKLIKIFGSHLFFLKIYLCGWLVPLIPVVLLVVIDHESYTKKFTFSQNTLCCYPSGLGFWLGVFIPIASMVLINTGIYLNYLCKFINKMRTDKDANYKFNDIFNNFCMFFLLGVTWVFGVFSQNLIMSYLFCLLAPLQGFVLFLFIIVWNAEIKNLWKQKLNLGRAKSDNPVNEYSISKYNSTHSDDSRRFY